MEQCPYHVLLYEDKDWEEDDANCLAVCLDLGLVSRGVSEEEGLRNLTDLVQARLKDLLSDESALPKCSNVNAERDAFDAGEEVQVGSNHPIMTMEDPPGKKVTFTIRRATDEARDCILKEQEAWAKWMNGMGGEG